MNPLTRRAKERESKVSVENIIIAAVCGVVLGAMLAYAI